MKPGRESKLYPGVTDWLARHLRGKYPRAGVSAHDTHRTELVAFLRKENLHIHFEGYAAYEIQVDVTGIIQSKESVRLAFVECKVGPISLRDVGQLLGYSLVARPERSYLVSPEGLSDRLNSLLITYGRQDVLKYATGKTLLLARWDLTRGEVDLSTVVPKGANS